MGRWGSESVGRKTWTDVCNILGSRTVSVWQVIDLGGKDDTSY